MKVRITTGDWGGDYEASSGREAIKLFFADILSGKIQLCQLGLIGNFDDGSDPDPIPFRIAPALFKAGKISAEDLWKSVRAAGMEFEDAELMQMVWADRWMIEPAAAKEGTA